MADDYSANTTTTGKLSVGGSTTGAVDTVSDADWFKISLTAGTTYLFSVSGAASGAGTLSNFSGVGLTVYDAQGNYANGQSSASYRDNTGVVMQFAAQSSSTYFVSVSSSWLGTYTLKAATPAADDYSSDTHTTGSLQAGIPVSGAFERADDSDWFKFHADAGQIISFTGTGALSDPSAYYYATVYDAGGNFKSTLGQSPFVATTSGDYYLAVSSGGRIGSYTQTMQVISDDYSGDNSRPGQLTAGSQASGRVDYYGDVDRFKISLVEGNIYTFKIKQEGGSSLTPPSLSLYLPSGSYDYQGSGSTASDGTVTLRYLASTTGVYSVGISGVSGLSYVLSSSYGEADDYGNTLDTAAALTLGAAVSVKLQSPRDVDVFKVDLKAGVTYNFDISITGQWNYSLSSKLLDSSGQMLASMDYSNGRYSYAPSKDGTYYLSQSGSYSSADAVSFTLTASAAKDDFGANTSSAGRLSVGSSTKGEIESAGDRDWFAVSLNAGGYYWFKVDGAAEGGGTLPSYSSVKLKLLDSSGNVVATTDSYSYGTGVIVPFTATTKGTYYVEVGSTGSSGSYTVRAQLGKADDYGNDKAHAGALAPDTVIKGELELNTDKDFFKLSIVAGMTYAVEVAPQGSGTYYGLSLDVSGPGYLNVRYVSSSGKVVRLFEATASGDYYVSVGAPSGYNWTGGYTLVAKSKGYDDFSADTKTTAVLTPDAPLRGVISVEDDHDWIKVHLDAGRTYVFDLKGSKSGGGTLDTGGPYSYGAVMSLLNSNGSTLTSSSVPEVTSGSDPRIRYVATTTGDYYLDVRGGGQGGNTGSYTVVEVQTNLDTTGPKLVSSSIAAGAAGVPLKSIFTLIFDETIMLSRGVSITDGYGAVVQGVNGALQATVSGNTLTVDPHANLMPGMTYTVNLPQGSVVDLAGNATSGSQSFSFTVVKPVASGTAGNDYLIGSGNGLALDGGAGTDTVYYASSRSYFNVTRGSDGGAVVKDYRASGVGGDKLAGVERLLFSDGAYALDVEGIAGQAYRLYQGAFNRTPDQEGLGFWISHMDKGLSLHDAANFFIASPEFARTFGAAPTDAEFVTLLYKNVLHRAPDTDGNSFWMGHLNNGMSRADVLSFFSESPENHDAVAKLIGNGFSYTPYGG